ncbi:peptidylprolyl isomerase [Nakamurella endophytica]|uniref:Peptidyl-prolyl cis-trans isomerase B n=1 Tax=Nakamurella endophytica TaxID=1748367 RepID=A0A917T8T7_9ACTN|nr:peptidylprolyl isomerase [Nakamurella endophytica]GGM14105.1 putative peptidyl-prolyl cis-trans isomerase B [Nakamurella endophytica]
MPTNQQRREAAKRKLERQLVRREEAARQRRQRLLIVGVVAAVLVVAGTVLLITTRKSDSASGGGNGGAASGSGTPTSTTPSTPCSYPTASAAKTVKPVNAPTNLSPENKGTVDVTLTLNDQPVPVTLDRATAPCAVNSFLSLASQGFYNSTDCWRLTSSPGLNILQCGDPSGKGNGGPGYTFKGEVTATTKYPVGTIAMANSGPDTNGSQFFIVYKDSTLDPSYTVLGTVSADGMKVVDAVAAKGVAKNAQDGPPNEKVAISSVTVPENATAGTGSYPSTAASGAASSGAASAPPASGTTSPGASGAATGGTPTTAASTG